MFLRPSSPGSSSPIIAATTASVYRLDNYTGEWQEASTGLPDATRQRILTDFAGGDTPSTGPILYATASTAGLVKENIRHLYRSTDGALTWHPAGRSGPFHNPAIPTAFGLLATSPAYPKILYANISGGDITQPGHPGNPALWRSDDAGDTWRLALYQGVGPKAKLKTNVTNTSWLTGQWGWNRAPSALAVDPQNPDRALATTISSVFLTEDGARTWRQVHAPNGTKDNQPGGGMLVTSAWSYAIHPADPARRFIALTDFSGWRSPDGGATWQYRTEGNPWHNNTYAFAFDTKRPQRIWAACSTAHDIPTWRYQADLGKYPGGIVTSDDGGSTWKPVAETKTSGLPLKAATDIWLDPKSPHHNRTLWTALPGHGIYVTQNDGLTWEKRNKGLDTQNLNLLRIKGASDGPHDRLYALATMRPLSGGRNEPGSLYTSTDSGKTWDKIFTRPDAPFLTHIELDPSQPGTLYVTALHTIDSLTTATGGGVWKSTDHGKTWTHVFPKPAYAVSVDPRDSSRLYASSWFHRGDGLWTSRDGGATWESVSNYPYWRPLVTTFDPDDPDVIYVTNFGGGVYRGHRQSDSKTP